MPDQVKLPLAPPTPDELLKQLRDLCYDAMAHILEPQTPERLQTLVETFEALDTVLCRRAPLPKEWRPAP